jgi:putative ABC transport system permease protein
MSTTPPSNEGALAHRLAYDVGLAVSNLRSRPVQSFVTTLVVTLAIALFVAVAALNDGLQRGIITASDPFGVMVVGPKGSSQQLVLSTLLLQGLPIGNMDIDVYHALKADPRVALAVPIAFGDNVGGARVIGTDETFFTLGPAVNAPPSFTLSEGRLFEADFEAVLGSNAAAGLGLGIGEQFVPSHGVEAGLEEDSHDTPHTVVGILQPSATSFDSAVFTTVETVHAIHAEGDHAEGDHAEGDHAEGDPAEGDPAEGGHAEDQITAVLVRPTGFVEANELWREMRLGSEAQAVFPGRELGGLFDLLNQGQRVLTVVGYLAAIMAGLTVLLAIYSATAAREQTIAIMRGLGASRGSVFIMVMGEAILLTLFGALLGRLLGYGIASVIGRLVSTQSAIPVTVRFLPELEPFLWLLPILLGLLAGLVPALMAYRVDVVEKLFPT